MNVEGRMYGMCKDVQGKTAVYIYTVLCTYMQFKKFSSSSIYNKPKR